MFRHIVDQTGPGDAEKLLQMARQAYTSRHSQEELDRMDEGGGEEREQGKEKEEDEEEEEEKDVMEDSFLVV